MTTPFTLTRELRSFAEKRNIILGIVSAKEASSIPRHWVGWKIKSYTKQVKEIMEDAESVVMVMYPVWDDIFEVAVRGPRGGWRYPGYFPLFNQVEQISFFLEKIGFKTMPHPMHLPLKSLARLAGFGSFGKNSLIINPSYGPWIRFDSVLTDAKLLPDKPFEQDLCGECTACIEACPVGALKPYRVDPERCMVGVHLLDVIDPSYGELLQTYEPKLTRNAHLMCRECQRICPYGRPWRDSTRSDDKPNRP